MQPTGLVPTMLSMLSPPMSWYVEPNGARSVGRYVIFSSVLFGSAANMSELKYDRNGLPVRSLPSQMIFLAWVYVGRKWKYVPLRVIIARSQKFRAVRSLPARRCHTRMPRLIGAASQLFRIGQNVLRKSYW